MRISGVEVVSVSVPFEAPLRWAWGVDRGTRRNVVIMRTDEGLVGLGETRGGENVKGLVVSLSEKLKGHDPFDFEVILSKLQLIPYHSGYAGYAAIAGMEMALWDLMGKAANRPLYQLLGGMCRKEIPFSAYVHYRYASPDGVGGESTPDDIVMESQNMVEEYGFTVLKLKGGVFPPEHDIRTVKAMREAFGSKVQLRLDPNGVWSPQTACRVGRQLFDCDLEYLEDPTWGMDGMARVRRDLPIPLATNMCVVEFDHIPPAIRMGVVDVILGDIHKWGGIWAVKKLAAVCECFRLGMSIHSSAELGVSTAANLHLVASTPYLSYAIDGYIEHLVDDIIAERFRIKDGSIAVPEGPGLGVSLNEEKVRKYSMLYQSEGDHRMKEKGDPYRPSWIPAKTVW